MPSAETPILCPVQTVKHNADYYIRYMFLFVADGHWSIGVHRTLSNRFWGSCQEMIRDRRVRYV